MLSIMSVDVRVGKRVVGGLGDCERRRRVTDSGGCVGGFRGMNRGAEETDVSRSIPCLSSSHRAAKHSFRFSSAS